MNRTTRGFTVLEVMIATALFFAVVVGSMWEFFRRSGNQSKELFEETGLSIEVERAYSILEREVFNSAYMQDAEGLDAASDNGYAGLAALNGSQPTIGSALATLDCQFSANPDPTLPDPYSAIRYTTVNAKLFPERTRAAWNEMVLAPANALPDILYTYLHPADSQFLFENGVKNSEEIYLQDADARSFRRYRVVSADSYQGPIDPSTGVSSATVVYKYARATVAMPQTFTGNTVTPIDRVFITNSSVYSAETRVTCIDSQGRLIQKSQYAADPNAANVLLDPKGSGYKFTSFAISFGNLIQSRSALIRNINFYNWNASTNNHWRECLNVVKIAMSFNELSTAKTKSYSRTFLINSKNLQRAADCETVVAP